MALKQAMSNQLPRRGTNIVVYGAGGSGKTTIAGDLADCEYGKPVVIIDAEGGTSVLSHRDDIDVLSITNEDGKGWQDIEKVTDDIISGKRGYKGLSVGGDSPAPKIGTLVLDNLSEFRTLALSHVVKTFPRNISDKDRPDQNDYGKMTSMMLTYVRKVRDFSRNSQTNVVFIAWDLPEMNADGNVYKNAISLNPALRRDFPGIVDCVGYLKVVMGRRVLSFEASVSTDAKFRRAATDLARSIPETLRWRSIKTQPLSDIISTLTGGVPFPVMKYSGKAQDEAAEAAT